MEALTLSLQEFCAAIHNLAQMTMAKNDLQPLSRYVTRGLYGIGAENVGAPPVRLGAAEGEPKALNAFFSMQLAWPATAAERHAMLPVRRASHPASWASSTRPPSLPLWHAYLQATSTSPKEKEGLLHLCSAKHRTARNLQC